MANTFSVNFFKSRYVKKYWLSSSAELYGSDTDVSVGANQYIIAPMIPSPLPIIELEPQQKRPTYFYQKEGGSGEADVKLSKIASDVWAGQTKVNGGPWRVGSNTGDSYPEVPPGFEPISKRPKTTSEPEGSRKPGEMFKRIFSEEDEIVLIHCMICYWSEKKADPFEDVNAFHEFVMPKLHSEPNVPQLLSKMRKIKTKYEKNKRREDSGRKSRLLKAHEHKAYELSKLVNWKGRKGRKSIPATPVKGMEATLKPAAAIRMDATKIPVGKTNAGGNKGKTSTENTNVGGNKGKIPAEKTNGGGNKGKTSTEKTSGGGYKWKTPTENTSAGRKDMEILVEKTNAGRNEAFMNGGISDLIEIVSWNQDKMDNIGVRMFEGEKRVEGEAEWRKLKMRENEMYGNMLDLIGDKAKLIARGLKNEYYA